MKQPTSYQLAVLGGINSRQRHVYGGTVSEQVVQQRRAANRRARKSRRINRRRSR